MWALSLLPGIAHVSCCAWFALRNLVSMSATGSVIVIVVSFLFDRFRLPVTGADPVESWPLRPLEFWCTANGKPSCEEQSATFVIGLGRGHDGDVETAHPINVVRVDFVKHRLLGQTEGVVSVSVELLVRQATEVSDARKRQG
jgi:hypothetical protein